MEPTTKATLRAVWEAAAPGWARWEYALSAGLQQATEQLIDAAGVAEGARVLDVASGAGAQTLRAAARVGERGSVVASDISATMLQHLHANAEAAGLADRIETAEGAAEDIASERGPFDAAICRLGLMLFPAPTESARAVHDALRPDGRFAVMVVAPPAQNPLFARSMQIVLAHAGKQPPAPGRPGLFALAAPGALEGVLQAAGFADVEVVPVQARFELPSADQALAMMQQAFGAYRAVLADLDPAAQDAAWAEVHTFLRSLEGESGLVTAFSVLIGSGRRAA